MEGVCLTCGLYTDLEAHHVAGRHNHATLTVPVCVDCHRMLSHWQLAAGIELHHDADVSDLDATRALLVGTLHLLVLYGQRHGDVTWIRAPLSVYMARAVSKLLDMFEPASRPGRWLPDPTMPPLEAIPVRWPAASEADRITEMADLTLELSQILGQQPPFSPETLTAISADPVGFQSGFDKAAADLSWVTALLEVIDQYSELSESILCRLLQLDHVEAVDESLIVAVAGWSETVGRLFNQLSRLFGG